jgi:hypothetical protein
MVTAEADVTSAASPKGGDTPSGAGSGDPGQRNLFNGPLEIESSSFRFANRHPTVFAEVVQKPLRAVPPFLRTWGAATCRQ